MTGLLPGPLAYKFSRIEPYGFFILLALLFSGVLGQILFPLIIKFQAIISAIFIF